MTGSFNPNLRALFFAIFLTSACNTESGDPQTPDEDDDEQEQDEQEQDDDNSSAGATKDAGKQDASQDAGKKDAGAEDDDDSDDDQSGDDDSDDDSNGDDEGPADSGARDAGRIDGGSADAGRGGDARTGDTGGGAASCDELTYESFGEEFATTYCARSGCHTGARPAGEVDLSTLDGFVTHKAMIKAEAVTATAMPPATATMKPSAADRAKLGQWLDSGPN